MNKRFGILSFFLISILFFPTVVFSASHASWNHVVDEMEDLINQSYDIYQKGDIKKAKESIDKAYFGYYEKLGFEKTVMAYISGARATQVEYQFSFVKKDMSAQRPLKDVRSSLNILINFLREDANHLDGKGESALGVFLASLLIIVREGFEAILIIGTIISYLVRSGHKTKVKPVYVGSLLALVASVIMAFILSRLTGLSGANQEIVEGITMLFAVLVLFYISNWMIAEAESHSWSLYLKRKVQTSLTQGSLFSLALMAFLAVFREGAETILFYQALWVDIQVYANMFWLGIGIGSALLVVIYFLIYVLSVRLPLKFFFRSTSLLLSIMAISFTGTGIKELQEGNLISVTPIGVFHSFEILGIYPTLETLIPQILLLLVIVITFSLQMKKWQKAREEATLIKATFVNES